MTCNRNELVARLRGTCISAIRANYAVLGPTPLITANEAVQFAAAQIEADGREIERLRAKLDELDFLHREGGPQSVAAMEEALRLIVISPRLTHLSPEQQHERCVNIAGAAVGECREIE